MSTDSLSIDFDKYHNGFTARHSFSFSLFFLNFILSLIFVMVCNFIGFNEDIEKYKTILANDGYQHVEIISFIEIYFGNFLLSFIGVSIATIISIIFSKTKTFRKSSIEILIAAFFVSILSLFLFHIPTAFGILTCIICLVYSTNIFFRLIAIIFGNGSDKFPHEICGDENLPIYTILLPLYKEGNMVHKLIKRISNIDYPKEKLDVKLLIEDDDEYTKDALKDTVLPDFFDLIIVPDKLPKTKPRACNYGLERAKGEFLVIYDAEDIPDTDQLKKAVTLFSHQTDLCACVQARLAFHNVKQNWLTKLFFLEYNCWFNRFLYGLVKMNSPIPLGGTSNHFRIDAIKEVKGWDPYNVTEDCDLGIRLYQNGYHTEMLQSTTWEEANSAVGNWIRQRSRWQKGYMQTSLVWMRHPIKTLFNLGFLPCLQMLIHVSSSAFLPVINPIMWLLLLYYTFAIGYDLSNGFEFINLISERAEINAENLITSNNANQLSWQLIYAGEGENPFFSIMSIILLPISVFMLISNFIFIILQTFLGGHKDHKTPIFTGIFLMPIYWIMMSISAWKAFWQLFINPHYWEKTNHGLDTSSEEND